MGTYIHVADLLQFQTQVASQSVKLTFWVGLLKQYSNIDGENFQMKQTPAQLEAHKRYVRKFDDIKVRVPKGERQIYSERAKLRGYKSLNSYIIALMKKDELENDNEN